MGYTSSNGRDCHALISSTTTSVTFEINSRDAFTPYTSSRCDSMSRVVMPREYSERIVSSMFPIRRARFGTVVGSNEPFRSRGTSRLIGPFFGVFDLRRGGRQSVWSTVTVSDRWVVVDPRRRRPAVLVDHDCCQGSQSSRTRGHAQQYRRDTV